MSFSVTIVPSGRQFQMQRDDTVLTAALQAGRQGLPMPPLPAVSVGE